MEIIEIMEIMSHVLDVSERYGEDSDFDYKIEIVKSN